MTLTMSKISSEEVAALVSKGAVISIPSCEDGFISSVFAIPKSSGGYRPVINLKLLNYYIKYGRFHMEGLHSVSNLVRPRDGWQSWT